MNITNRTWLCTEAGHNCIVLTDFVMNVLELKPFLMVPVITSMLVMVARLECNLLIIMNQNCTCTKHRHCRYMTMNLEISYVNR